MFNNYEMVDEKVLVLYIDSFYEFGIDLKKHHRNISMIDQIKKIVKQINFTGEKIVLMIGGILLATILIVENPNVSDNFNLIYVADNILPISEIVDTKEKSAVPINDIVEEKIDKAIKKEENSERNSIIPKSSIIVEEKNYMINSSTIEKTNSSSKIITIYRNNGSVIELDLEEYLIGVVGAEMPASFNIEALKVQAIISRTYALKSIEMGRKLTDDVKTQTYKDNDELRRQWGSSYDKYYSKVKDAVNSTKALAIFYDNKYIDAVFHSTSNGKTEDARYVWNNSVPYLKSVDSKWDISANSYLRSEERKLNDVLYVLGVTEGIFSIISRDESGRVLEIKVGDRSYTGVEFRNLLSLRSTDFDIELNNDKISFTTRGYGHGVGLSQYGANGMANAGYNYENIIKHYYAGVEIK